ncbi:MAG: DUF547 domain-containing protein [Saprospiraceae bacterium]|nr:DUF547 domain-containing protein [Saprospiraceae bacterium]
MRYTFILLFLCTVHLAMATTNPLVALSKELLQTVKEGKNTAALVDKYAQLTVEELEANLKTDKEKLAFWLNTYNGFIQVILGKNPELYEDRGSFFKNEMINIAGQKLAFADIEHGIIRHSQFEYFLGYITNPFPDAFERKMRVDNRDFRIHFALNCGAKDCPPVAIYDDTTLNDQLRKGTTKYLKSKTYVKDSAVHTTTLFRWFKGDFGGGDGIRDIIKQYAGIEVGDKDILTDTYDWTLSLGDFIDL